MTPAQEAPLAYASPHADQYRQFARQTRRHRLSVLHQDGLYRHLRVAQPDTRMWSWDVITWPGHLTIVGDVADGFTFTRIPDMLDFFDTTDYPDLDGVPYINPDYWAEKLSYAHRGRDVARTYSPDIFTEYVSFATEDAVFDGVLTESAARDLRASALWHRADEHEALEWLRDNGPDFDQDWWETSLRGFDHQYVIACFAIVTTVRAYRDHVARGPVATAS